MFWYREYLIKYKKMYFLFLNPYLWRSGRFVTETNKHQDWKDKKTCKEFQKIFFVHSVSSYISSLIWHIAIKFPTNQSFVFYFADDVICIKDVKYSSFKQLEQNAPLQLREFKLTWHIQKLWERTDAGVHLMILDNGLLLERQEQQREIFLTQWLLGISVRYILALEAIKPIYSQKLLNYN